MLLSQINTWPKIAYCLTFFRRLFVKCETPICWAADVKMEFCFAKINSIAADTLKTINDAREEYFRRHIFKMKMVDNFRWWFENDF